MQARMCVLKPAQKASFQALRSSFGNMFELTDCLSRGQPKTVVSRCL
jgi:hypothetical protein